MPSAIAAASVIKRFIESDPQAAANAIERLSAPEAAGQGGNAGTQSLSVVLRGLAIALAMVANLVAAGLAGAVIPLLMKRVRFDPAQSSGIFLGLATLFQAKLL